MVTRPQWLASALGSIITSSPSRWVNQEVQAGFKRLRALGWIEKEMLLLAYRCARMGHKYWSEMLFILNCMDLITCHPSLHLSKAVYVPAMVVRPPPTPPPPHLASSATSTSDPAPVYFDTSEGSAFPIALFNQLVVRCLRSSQYEPVLYHRLAHLRLNSSHHLLLWMEPSCVGCVVQAGVEQSCEICVDKCATRWEFEPECSTIAHLLGPDVEFMPTDNMSVLIASSTNSGVLDGVSLAFPDSVPLERLCPAVLEFLTRHLEFLCGCWFPGLDLQLAAHQEGGEREREGEEGGEREGVTVLDQFWKHTVLGEGRASKKLAIWFSQ